MILLIPPSHKKHTEQIEIEERKEKRKEKKKNSFPNPKGKGKPQSLKVSLLPQGTMTLSNKGQLFYDLGEEGEDHLSLGRET